jgi:hypothetical protein
MPPAKPTALANVAKELTPEELTALLQQAGWAEKPSGDSLPRMSMNGMMLTTPDGEMYVYNPNKPLIPACTVRIVRAPDEYWAYWIDGSVARAIGRPDLEGTFSKKWSNPDPTRRTWPSDEVYDVLKATDGVIDDRGNPLKASWKGDMQVQVIPESGTLIGTETVYLLTLSTTSLIEFKGSFRAPSAGSLSDDNFITKLSKFAMQQEGVTDPSKAVIDALTSLTLGGVAAEVRILRAENKNVGTTWSVISFDPVHIEPMEQGDLLTAGDEAAE